MNTFTKLAVAVVVGGVLAVASTAGLNAISKGLTEGLDSLKDVTLDDLIKL